MRNSVKKNGKMDRKSRKQIRRKKYNKSKKTDRNMRRCVSTSRRKIGGEYNIYQKTINNNSSDTTKRFTEKTDVKELQNYINENFKEITNENFKEITNDNVYSAINFINDLKTKQLFLLKFSIVKSCENVTSCESDKIKFYNDVLNLNEKINDFWENTESTWLIHDYIVKKEYEENKKYFTNKIAEKNQKHSKNGI